MSTSNQRLRFLHLEDSPRDAEIIESLLGQGGLTPEIELVTSSEAYRAALEARPYDVVLCDYNVPGYAGYAAVQEAHEKQPNTPVLVISGSIGEEEAVKCLHEGATDYLLKERLERLVPAVKRALKGAQMSRAKRIAEEQLRESEERFRQLAEQSSEGFWFINIQPYRALYVSPSLLRIWDRSEEELTPDPTAWLNTVHAEEQAALVKAWTDCVEGRMPRFELEYRVIRPDSSVRWVLGNGVAIRDSEGRIQRMGGTVRDITERKEMETQMLRAQRLESIGTLAGGIAHDLNNTLVPIMMAAGMLRLQYPDAGVLLDAVDGSAKRAADMVKQLLTFARGIEGARLQVQSQHVVEEVGKIVRSTFPKNLQFRVNFPPHLPVVLGDPTQLHQVLLNLCVNARDAMPDGGRLSVELGTVDVDDTYAAAHPEAKAGKYLVWKVTDSGSGMAPETVERIFEPFFSTKGPDKGTGLGLSTVIGIIKSHGGFVHVRSAVGEGSTFEVYLPAAEVGSSPAGNVMAQREPFRGQGETVLIVDDESAVREVTARVLARQDFQVITAADGTEALLRVGATQGQVKAVITDLHMPNMDGLTFVLVLRRMLPDAAVIVSSGRMEELETRQFEEMGVRAFLHKPFTEEQLLDALRLALAPMP